MPVVPCRSRTLQSRPMMYHHMPNRADTGQRDKQHGTLQWQRNGKMRRGRAHIWKRQRFLYLGSARRIWGGLSGCRGQRAHSPPDTLPRRTLIRCTGCPPPPRSTVTPTSTVKQPALPLLWKHHGQPHHNDQKAHDQRQLLLGVICKC